MTGQDTNGGPFCTLQRLLIACAVFLLMGIPLAPVASAVPPANFQSTQIIGTGLDGPSGFEFAPDGRIFIIERTGKVKIFKNGALLPTPFADLPSVASGDRGMIGIAFDPDFAVNCYVYFYYTSADDLLNRLVRFRACGDVGTDGPFTIYQTSSPSQELHVGGSIRFGADGKMYFAVGDNGYPPNAQNLANPHGKILRINKDGSVPADNPFVGQAGALPEIWAYGFRNPWRFQFDSANQEMYGSDVGDFTWEEMNHIVKGGNYGWPLAEGMCSANCTGLINPIYTYNHNGQSAAATGGPVYRATMFPAEYRGSLFFGDYGQGFIKRIKLNPDGSSAGVFDFDVNAGSVVDLKVAPDGSMYYLTYFPGRLYRVTYNTGNQVPSANATADVTKGVEPLTVHFSSAGSSDPDGTPLTYAWKFGDGSTSTAANPTKTYPNKGTYTVELTVSDGVNTAQAVPIVIQVGIPPNLTVGLPAEGSTYKAGDSITYNAHATDGAGLDLNDAGLSTDVIFHHDTHVHPFLDDLIGRSRTFTIPDHGEAAANTWYEIKVTATDANGLSTSKSVNIFPRKINLTYASSPADVGFYLDGVPITTPRTASAVEGFKREVAAYPIKKAPNGQMYQFDHWSDGGAIRHEITTPAADATITAYYAPAPAFRAEYFNNINLTGTPTIVKSDPEINFNWAFGSPDPALPIDKFSVRWTKDQQFAAGRYKFTTATDDGVRLFIDGQLVIDEWHGQGGDAHFATVDLAAGMHNIKMEYFEDAGGALARLGWDTTPDQPTTPPTPAGFQAEYFANPSLTMPVALARTDAAINFDWGGGGPAPGLPVDNFSARWTKTETLAAGNYTFTATADDGLRLYVDGELVLDKWIDQAPTTYTVSKELASGPHTIKMEYYERGGGAVAKLGYVLSGPPQPTGCPAGWTCGDIGGTTLAGSTAASAGTFTVKGSGWDIWNTDDQFHYAWQPLTGDGTITARITGQTNTNPWAKAGVMIKESATAGAKYAFAAATPGNGLRLQSNFNSDTAAGASVFPTWLRLTRTGDTFTSFRSTDGTTWTQTGTTTIPMGANVTAGLAVTAHDGTQLSTATFDNVSLSTSTALPSGWASADIGGPGLMGTSTYSAGTFTVKGSGWDIWDVDDQFQYAYRTLMGNGSITARIKSQTNTNPWAKAGVMIRDTAASGKPYAMLAATPGNGLHFQYNLHGDTAAGPYAFPAWLRLTRTGATVAAFTSTDGTTWTPAGSTVLALGSTATFGLFSTAHDGTQLSTATFDNVTVGP